MRLTQSSVRVDENDPAGSVMVCAEVVSGSLAPGQTASATLTTQGVGSALCKCNELTTAQFKMLDNTHQMSNVLTDAYLPFSTRGLWIYPRKHIF